MQMLFVWKLWINSNWKNILIITTLILHTQYLIYNSSLVTDTDGKSMRYFTGNIPLFWVS